MRNYNYVPSDIDLALIKGAVTCQVAELQKMIRERPANRGPTYVDDLLEKYLELQKRLPVIDR